MQQDHDGSYRRLFAEPRMIRDLVRGYLREPWCDRLDFSTLQRYAEDRVGPGLEKRHSDLVWRVRLRTEAGARDPTRPEGEWLYVFLLLEFQSEVDPFMALRLLVYLGLLYQELSREPDFRQLGRLPPVLPIVLYNGQRRWKAVTNVARLIRDVPEFEAYRPQMSYLILEQGDLPERQDNLASVLFALERCRSPEEIDRRVAQLARLLPAAEDTGLRKAFIDFLRVSLLPNRFPEAKFPETQNLEEIRPMLRDTVIGWTKEAEQQGLERGRLEGRLEGRQEGEASLLLRQLERRFGNLDPETRQRVQSADVEELLEWGDRFVEARTLDEVFQDPS